MLNKIFLPSNVSFKTLSNHSQSWLQAKFNGIAQFQSNADNLFGSKYNFPIVEIFWWNENIFQFYLFPAPEWQKISHRQILFSFFIFVAQSFIFSGGGLCWGKCYGCETEQKNLEPERDSTRVRWMERHHDMSKQTFPIFISMLLLCAVFSRLGWICRHQSVKMNDYQSWATRWSNWKWAYKSFHHHAILVHFHLKFSDKKWCWCAFSFGLRQKRRHTTKGKLRKWNNIPQFGCLWIHHHHYPYNFTSFRKQLSSFSEGKNFFGLLKYENYRARVTWVVKTICLF